MARLLARGLGTIGILQLWAVSIHREVAGRSGLQFGKKGLLEGLLFVPRSVEDNPEWWEVLSSEKFLEPVEPGKSEVRFCFV